MSITRMEVINELGIKRVLDCLCTFTENKKNFIIYSDTIDLLASLYEEKDGIVYLHDIDQQEDFAIVNKKIAYLLGD